MFNHNMYLSLPMTNAVIRRNIVSDASATGISFNGSGEIYENLLIRNPVGIFARTAPAIVRNNVVMEATDINPSLLRGFGIIIGDAWESEGGPAVVEENLVVDNQGNGGHPAIFVERRKHMDTPLMDVTIDRNRVLRWGAASLFIEGQATGSYQRLLVRDNVLDDDEVGTRLVSAISSVPFPAEFEFDANQYRRAGSTSGWFLANGVAMSLSQWIAQVESNATQFSPSGLPDGDAGIAEYLASIGSVGGFDEFIAEALRQSRDLWRSEYTARFVIEHLRSAYGMPALPPI